MQPLACDLWLMERGAFKQFVALASVSIDSEQAKAAAAVTPRKQRNIGIIPIHGALEARPSFIGEILGMSSYERIGMAFDVLMADESISGIVLDVASPGGMVYGAMELADKIFRGRGQKPIVAVANPMAASGAYWIAAAADRIVSLPSGDVGSVGVISEHVDLSKAFDADGAKVTTIRSTNSPFKGETTDSEPLSDEARANMQARADQIYDRFVGDLARFRGVSVEHVNEHFGKGRIVDSKRAMVAGMIDRVGTLQDTVMRMLEGRIRLHSERSQDNWETPTRKESLLERVAALNATIESIPKVTEKV